MIKLIINADDFGYSKLINKKILELIEGKYITSTSVMVDYVESNQKDQVMRLISLSKNKTISIGLHVYFKNENFQEEIKRQFKKFIEIFNFVPHYLDIHKTIYLEKGYPIIQKFCKEKNLPCKNLDSHLKGIMVKDILTNKGISFSATHKSFEEIKDWIIKLDDRMHLINFHPGYYDSKLKSSLNKEREVDANHIMNLREIFAKKEIRLANFHDLKK